ncbi:zf-RING_2 domain-containing protein [Cephalotus follicularis]|uniref:RING-type E3 ubiquitin transferase n=1 Tax=Cephalotus follicularis TaxID=3775 RepID=A0A1Q3CNY0_CEPFO|nr:zf-RING_2 domain-containing protein [Cephalotus follicularis]
MPFLAESALSSSSSSTIAENMRLRRPRNQMNQQPINEPDPSPRIPSILQSTRCKSSISSLFLSTFSKNNTTNETTPTPTTNTNTSSKKKNTFRGLGGCTAAASQQVSVPAIIKASADWEEEKVVIKKKKKKKKQQQNMKQKCNNRIGSNSGSGGDVGDLNSGGFGVIPDVWCGPGIGLSADAVGSVDCVVAKRNVPADRGKIDGEKISKREREQRSSCLSRRTVNPESLSFWDSDSVSTRPEPDIFATRYYRHVRHPSPDGFAEIMILQNSLLMGGRLDSHDRFREWRLDVDNMTYEQLLELGDRIGYVSTGLKEDEIGRCLRKIKHSVLNDLPPLLPMHVDMKCSICQEEYEADDEIGNLVCGHSFHLPCIKQWLAQKNTCPVCKNAPTDRP